MEPLWVGIGGIGLFIVLLLLGFHVAIALALPGIVGLFIMLGTEATVRLFATTPLEYGLNFILVVVPLFIAMGYFAAETGMSRDMYDAAGTWLGRIKGGLGLATIGACTGFGTLTGSSIATAVVFARVSSPEMIRHGYDKKLAYGLVSASGAIGMMIPPSVMAIIYAVVTEESIGKLLIGGIGPGIVLALCLGGGLILLLTLRPKLGPPATGITVTWKERFRSLPKIWPVLVVGLVVIGGIYSGIFTVTEAAAVGNFILFALFLILSRLSRKSLSQVGAVLRETISVTAMVLLLFCFAQIFTRMLVFSGITEIMTSTIIGLALGKIQLVIVAGLLYILLGCFLDSISIIMITVPIFLPIITTLGINPIWFAMVLILATQIGLITPPLGINIFAVKGVAGSEIELTDLFKGAFPFFIFSMVALFIVIFVPQLSTWLPYQMIGH